MRHLRDTVVEIMSDYGFKRPNRMGWRQHITAGIYDKPFYDYKELQSIVLSSVTELKRLVEITDIKMRLQ